MTLKVQIKQTILEVLLNVIVLFSPQLSLYKLNVRSELVLRLRGKFLQQYFLATKYTNSKDVFLAQGLPSGVHVPQGYISTLQGVHFNETKFRRPFFRSLIELGTKSYPNCGKQLFFSHQSNLETKSRSNCEENHFLVFNQIRAQPGVHERNDKCPMGTHEQQVWETLLYS